jgi:hypothetical protein
MKIEINIFTVLKKESKNVSERSCPFSNLKIYKVYKLVAFKKTLQRFKQEWQKKSSFGTRQTDGKNLVWFGEIERKLAKLSINYRSSSELFYDTSLLMLYLSFKFLLEPLLKI